MANQYMDSYDIAREMVNSITTLGNDGKVHLTFPKIFNTDQTQGYQRYIADIIASANHHIISEDNIKIDKLRKDHEVHIHDDTLEIKLLFPSHRPNDPQEALADLKEKILQNISVTQAVSHSIYTPPVTIQPGRNVFAPFQVAQAQPSPERAEIFQRVLGIITPLALNEGSPTDVNVSFTAKDAKEALAIAGLLSLANHETPITTGMERRSLDKLRVADRFTMDSAAPSHTFTMKLRMADQPSWQAVVNKFTKCINTIADQGMLRGFTIQNEGGFFSNIRKMTQPITFISPLSQLGDFCAELFDHHGCRHLLQTPAPSRIERMPDGTRDFVFPVRTLLPSHYTPEPSLPSPPARVSLPPLPVRHVDPAETKAAEAERERVRAEQLAKQAAALARKEQERAERKSQQAQKLADKKAEKVQKEAAEAEEKERWKNEPQSSAIISPTEPKQQKPAKTESIKTPPLPPSKTPGIPIVMANLDRLKNAHLSVDKQTIAECFADAIESLQKKLEEAPPHADNIKKFLLSRENLSRVAETIGLHKEFTGEKRAVLSPKEQMDEKTAHKNAKTFFAFSPDPVQWIKDNSKQIPALPLLFAAALNNTVNKGDRSPELNEFIDKLKVLPVDDLKTEPDDVEKFIETFCSTEFAVRKR